ncbi:DUF1285 domain-containing protein [Curvivirga sp.]|uniref:DUF1285 domain-containing protein n=1 Tax=Curvivirga sp. TaxID=2856848 RepID=UPI003B58F893
MNDPLKQLESGMNEAEKAAKQSIKELMENGQGLRDFPWPDQICNYDMFIARNGDWYHEGGQIKRQALCKLFSTILQKDDEGQFWLVTPVEKGKIEVEDAPFVAVEMIVEGQGKDQTLSLRSNLDHWVTVDKEHPLRIDVDLETDEPAPYVLIRDDLEALIVRSVFYDLVALAEEIEHEGQVKLGIWSSGHFFEIGSLEEG